MSNNNSSTSGKHSKKKPKNKKKLTIIISIILLVVVGLGATGYLYANNLLGKVKRKEINEENLGIKEEVTQKVERDKINNIVNIALFGIDRDEDEYGRSDAIMIATFDPIHKKLKATSILRDTYVEIEGYGRDKANHAHAYGGPELAINMLNKNFDLNITDYVEIDFDNLEHVVDALGGIEMPMSEEEAVEVNDYTRRMSAARDIEDDPVTLKENGKADLDGFQALGYCRIRSTAGGDLDRSGRHRKLLNEMFNKVSELGVGELASLSVKLLPYVETSLTNKEIMDLAYNVLTLGTKNMEQERFPMDDYLSGAAIGTGEKTFYFCYDEEYTAEQISKYIFEDKKIWLDPNPKQYIPNVAKYGGMLWDDYINGKTSNNSNQWTAPTNNQDNNNLNNNNQNTNNNSTNNSNNNGTQTVPKDPVVPEVPQTPSEQPGGTTSNPPTGSTNILPAGTGTQTP